MLTVFALTIPLRKGRVVATPPEETVLFILRGSARGFSNFPALQHAEPIPARRPGKIEYATGCIGAQSFRRGSLSTDSMNDWPELCAYDRPTCGRASRPSVVIGWQTPNPPADRCSNLAVSGWSFLRRSEGEWAARKSGDATHCGRKIVCYLRCCRYKAASTSRGS